VSQEQSARVVQAMHESELYAMETDQAAHASQVASRRADQTLRAAIQEAAAEAAKQALRTVMLEGSGARDGARDLRRPDGRYESRYEGGSNLEPLREPAAPEPGARHGALLEPTDLLLRAVMSEQDSWLERWPENQRAILGSQLASTLAWCQRLAWSCSAGAW
jgi:hypothetical protein